jgi:hypothetical protein
VEKPPPVSPLALALRFASALTRAALLTTNSHHRAASMPSVQAIRSALTPCTFCTEFLPGAPATEAGQQSSLRRCLPPHELTVDCRTPSSSSRASTSRRSPGVSRPTSTTPSPSTTSCLSRRRLPPHRREPRRHPPPLVSALPSHALDRTHRCVL